MTISRRSFFTGMVAALAAPAVIKSGILMPVKTPFFTPPSRIALNHPIQASSRLFFSEDGGSNWKELANLIVEDIEERCQRPGFLARVLHGDVILKSVNQQRMVGANHETQRIFEINDEPSNGCVTRYRVAEFGERDYTRA